MDLGRPKCIFDTNLVERRPEKSAADRQENSGPATAAAAAAEGGGPLAVAAAA